MGGVEGAQATIFGATYRAGELRVFDSTIVTELELLHLEIKPCIGIDQVPKFAVLDTAFFHVNRTILLEQPRLNSLQAFRANGLCGLGQALLQGFDQRTGKRRMRLNLLEVSPSRGSYVRSDSNSGHSASLEANHRVVCESKEQPGWALPPLGMARQLRIISR